MQTDDRDALSYLTGRLDKYVKQAGRNTIIANTDKDKHARYARIPDANACQFCKTVASHGFVYHSPEKRPPFHAHCNCQLAVSFDPVVRKFKHAGSGVTVSHGQAGARVSLIDENDNLKGLTKQQRQALIDNYDPDKLLREYYEIAKETRVRDLQRVGESESAQLKIVKAADSNPFHIVRDAMTRGGAIQARYLTAAEAQKFAEILRQERQGAPWFETIEEYRAYNDNIDKAHEAVSEIYTTYASFLEEAESFDDLARRANIVDTWFTKDDLMSAAEYEKLKEVALAKQAQFSRDSAKLYIINNYGAA